jgi:RNA polymerase sigma-70 factor (ECF subfamily)
MQDDGIALYRRFLSGDERGLEELNALYQRGLLRFIYGYVHDVFLAEDILTDVFFTLYYKRPFQERTDATLKTYLYKIARNKALNAVKKRKRKKEISLDSLTERGSTAPMEKEAQAILYGDAPTPHTTLERNERNVKIYAALKRLRADYRETLILRYFDGLSPKQISKITGKTVKRVYNLLARGKTALKQELTAEGISYEDV